MDGIDGGTGAVDVVPVPMLGDGLLALVAILLLVALVCFVARRRRRRAGDRAGG
ncbi:MAG TPA: hypothetical protein VGD66_10290 [Allosphingosinicella sp.]|jgi:hypothetical protein